MQGYEERKFNIGYLVFCVISTLAVSVALFLLFQEFDWRYWTAFSLYIVLLFCSFLYSRTEVKKLCREISQASDIMVQLVEEQEIPEEKYRQGEIGSLYTNLYKLVGTLKESRAKERDEKIFLRDIISDISHQLKTPLASLTVFVDLLYDERVEDADKRKQLLEESKNQLSRMEWMVLSMLKLARIEAGAIEFDKKETNLFRLLTQTKQDVAYLTEERHQTVAVDCREDCTLYCDGEWLAEGIINLLKNASDYSGENTAISVSVEETNVYTRIRVRDEGMGIPEENLPHIFKRFYRVNNEVNPNSVGIGLSLTKSIVVGMGGKITVRSELGKFTEFAITFVHV